MTPMLLSPGNRPQPVTGIDDSLAAEAVGPALIVAGDDAAALPVSPDPTTLSLRPLSYRERGGQWQEIGYEAADHWQALSPLFGPVCSPTARLPSTSWSSRR